MLVLISFALSAVTFIAVCTGFVYYFVSRRRRRHAPPPPPLTFPVAPTAPPLLLSPEPGAAIKGPYNLPSFGAPSIETYRASDYEIPLVCPDCKHEFLDGEKFYFIPLSDQPPGSALGVCLLCYGKAAS